MNTATRSVSGIRCLSVEPKHIESTFMSRSFRKNIGWSDCTRGAAGRDDQCDSAVHECGEVDPEMH